MMPGAMREVVRMPAGVASARPAVRPHWVQVVSNLDPGYGGLSAAVPELGWGLAEGLGAEPMEISLAGFCATHEHYQPAGYAEEQVSYWPVSRGAWMQDRVRGGGLRRRFTEELRKADGVHIHGLWEGSTAIAAETARALGRPYVLSAHGMLEPWALAQKRVKKAVYGRLVERGNVAGAACLHALTEQESQQFVRFGARSPIAIIPNAVACPADARGELFLDAHPELRGKRLVLFMARLHPKKGLDVLLEAWRAVAPLFDDAHLVIAGPDSEGTEARLRTMIAEHGLEGSVLLPGMLRGDTKWSALAAAEAFALPSFSEGLSVGVLEAMGMGLPVVATRGCNMPEIAQCEAGWVIEPNARELEGVLLEILRARPSTNRAIGRRGAALVEQRYTWPVIAGQMAEVYAWALGGRMPESVDLVFPA